MKPKKQMLLALPYLAFVMLGAPTADAQEPMHRYEMRVDGMVCAYCAYNVSQRLGRLEGVAAKSVAVDLEAKQIRFHSHADLPEPRIEEVLADSGFTVKAIERKTLNP